jgi:hypothetical protein
MSVREAREILEGVGLKGSTRSAVVHKLKPGDAPGDSPSASRYGMYLGDFV